MTNKPVRLFIAAWPDEPVRARLEDRLSLLPAGSPEQRPAPRPTHPLDLHLTLKFLGSTPPAKIPTIVECLDHLPMEPSRLILDRLSYWKRPKITVLEASQTPAALAAYVAALESRMTDLGCAPETRPYRAHITLVRKARPHPNQALEAPVVWPISQAVLIESTNQAEPPRYRRLCHPETDYH